FRLRNRRFGTGVIGMDELDIGLRLGRELNAGIDELNIEWPNGLVPVKRIWAWSNKIGFMMDKLDELGIGMFGDLRIWAWSNTITWYWNDQRLGHAGTGL
ncbi:5833_t:CDS:2, partial [Gigaspora margarita]